LTASADLQFACAVGQKSINEGYTQEIDKAINLSPDEHQSHHVSRTEKVLCKRQSLMKTPAFKKRRLELKNFELVYVTEKEISKVLPTKVIVPF
jgi:hypothetical protein